MQEHDRFACRTKCLDKLICDALAIHIDKSRMLVANLAASPYLGDAGIYIDYTFMGTEHTDKYIGDVANFLPMSGTIYTVELNFIGDAFVISFVVDNNQTWENGGDSDLEFE